MREEVFRYWLWNCKQYDVRSELKFELVDWTLQLLTTIKTLTIVLLLQADVNMDACQGDSGGPLVVKVLSSSFLSLDFFLTFFVVWTLSWVKIYHSFCRNALSMLQLTCVRTQMGSTYWKEWSALEWAVAMCKSLGFLSTCFRFELKIYLCHRCLRISHKHI